MEEKIIRFKSSPRIAHKRLSIFPESRYYNKLHNALRVFTKLKNLSRKFNDQRFEDERSQQIIKKEINDVFILTQCKLHDFPIKLYGNKFIETDYLEPYCDEFSLEKSPKYVLISKQYVLIDEIEAYIDKFEQAFKSINVSKVKVGKVRKICVKNAIQDYKDLKDLEEFDFLTQLAEWI